MEFGSATGDHQICLIVCTTVPSKINVMLFILLFLKVAALSMDPLGWKGGLKAKWAMAIHDAMEKIKENIPKFEWPFIVLHGDADQIAMVEGSVLLEQKAASKDKTIKVVIG